VTPTIGAPPSRDFRERKGYDRNFLGVSVPLPKLDESIQDRVAPLLRDPSEHELKYSHFSVIMEKERRQPLVTAENINGAQHREIERENDTWYYDGRIAREHQLGNEAYSDNTLDRSHMVRRSDVGWGKHARQANNDTFVYTNCALQYERLNRHAWADLERSVLDEAVAEGEKRTVFTGPILHKNDPWFDNGGKMDVPTQIPRKFFKVVVSREPGQGLETEAYIISQKKGRASRAEEPLTKADLQAFRVPLTRIEELTHLDFGRLT
jgi:endonuclease G